MQWTFNLADDILALLLMALIWSQKYDEIHVIVQCSQVTCDRGIWTDRSESSHVLADTDSWFIRHGDD